MPPAYKPYNQSQSESSGPDYPNSTVVCLEQDRGQYRQDRWDAETAHLHGTLYKIADAAYNQRNQTKHKQSPETADKGRRSVFTTL